MRTFHDCLPCFVSQALATVRRFGADEEAEERVMRGVLETLREADYHLSPPRIAQRVYPVIYAALGTSDPYSELKRESNRQARARYPQLERRVRSAADPFRAAVRLALAGNIIDLGTGHPIDLEATIDRVLEQGPVVDHTDELAERAASARRILYLADNAGEIVLDRLLIEQLPATAGREVVVAVRGGPTINDATIEDAVAAGLDGLEGVRIVEPGVTLPGIWLEGSSPAFREIFADADLILSKGQGNFETLHGGIGGDTRPICFLFMVKCGVVARETGLALGDPLVTFAGGVPAGDTNGVRPMDRL